MYTMYVPNSRLPEPPRPGSRPFRFSSILLLPTPWAFARPVHVYSVVAYTKLRGKYPTTCPPPQSPAYRTVHPKNWIDTVDLLQLRSYSRRSTWLCTTCCKGFPFPRASVHPWTLSNIHSASEVAVRRLIIILPYMYQNHEQRWVALWDCAWQ